MLFCDSDTDDHEFSYESAQVMPQLAGFYSNADREPVETAVLQSSTTLVVRGLSVGEIEFRDLFKVIFKKKSGGSSGQCVTTAVVNNQKNHRYGTGEIRSLHYPSVEL